MRRVLSEWGVIFFVPLSLACFVYWGVSLATHRANFELSLLSGTMQVGSAEGSLTLCDNLRNLEVTKFVEQGAMMRPAPISHCRLVIPGFRFHWIALGSGSIVWAVRLSWLLPATWMMILAVLCLFVYRRIRAAARLSAQAARQRRATVSIAASGA